ncbi:MAG: hypothetical protein K2J12_07475 [Muribaculaceae bacterium]|nr:hypothetical protein [Muribaculaceae bacterium]
MANIYKKPTPQNHGGRNGFDMSRSRSFTCTCGQLLPVYKDFANPGDKYKLDSYTMLRTEAMQTAAMMHLDIKVDWFFVPVTQLLPESAWNAFFDGTNDVMSSVFVDPDTNATSANLPNLPVHDVSKVLGHFEYFNHDISPNPGYNPGNTFFGDLHVVNGKNYYRLNVDEFGIPYAWNFRRLWDMFGYGSIDKYYDPDNRMLSFALLDFLAYHKIFHSHYRLTDWTANEPSLYNIDDLFTSVSNGTMLPVRLMKVLSTIHYNRYAKDYFTNIMPQPLFGGSFASFLSNEFNNGSDVRAAVNPEVFSFRADGDAYFNQLFNGSPNANAEVSAQSSYLDLVSPSFGNSISTSDVRAMFALDKLLRVTAFAGGHYDEQTLAHFGYKMPKGISNEVYYLGSQQVPIDINEVVATATTGFEENGVAAAGSAIGDIAGKAFAPQEQKGNNISFEAPCHGFVMAIFSVVPKPEYASMGCETFNRYRHSLDFYHPELDNVGMQPMFGVFDGISDNPNSEGLNGWSYRWAELKSTFDVINEGFWNTSKESWVGYKQSIYPVGFPSSRADFMRQFYCMPQYTNTIFALPVPFFSNSGRFEVPTPDPNNPDALTNIYEVPSMVDNSSWHNAPLRAQDVYETDNFLVKCYFKVFKSSIMSVHSLPKML